MAASILSNVPILLGGQRLSCHTNTVGIDYGAETQDDTSFCDDTRSTLGGLKTVGFSAEGFYEGAADPALFNSMGVSGTLISVANGQTVGDKAFSFVTVTGSYEPINGSVGDIAGFSINASARGDLGRGNVLFYDESLGSSTTGATFNAGSAPNQITAFLHVFGVSGTSPTLDVTIESDTADDFTGAEQTQITFDQATAQEAQRKTAGATSDTWWRVNATIGGTSPDFGFVVILILE